MGITRTVTIAADIDIGDALKCATVMEISAELDSRKEGGDGKLIAIDAINKIRRGDYADAITTLEREFLPKWNDRADCAAAYREAMAEPREWR
jgi:Flp pilus assembly protein TadD